MICLPIYSYHGYLFCCLRWLSVPYRIYSVVNVLWTAMQTLRRCILMPHVKVLTVPRRAQDKKLQFKNVKRKGILEFIISRFEKAVSETGHLINFCLFIDLL